MRILDRIVALFRALFRSGRVDADLADEMRFHVERETEANIARGISRRLGCGEKGPAWTVMRNCASGRQALDSAAVNILAGRSSLVLAGCTDAMSHAPLLFGPAMAIQGARAGRKRRRLFPADE